MSSVRRKRILILSRLFPYAPARGGDMSYSRGLATSFAHVADVTAVVATNGVLPDGPLDKDGVRWIIAGAPRKGRMGSVATRLPNIAWRGQTTAYTRAVELALQEEWDVIVIDHIGSYHVLPQVLAYRARRPATRVSYISHEHEASVRVEKYAAYGGNPLLRLALKLDGIKVGKAELDLVRSADLLSLINPDDAALYKAQLPSVQYVTLTPGYQGNSTIQRRIDASVPRRVVLLGGRESRQKQVILERWLEHAAPVFHRAGVEMAVVGPIDDALGDTLSGRYPTVRFMGFVDDIDAFLATCRASVVADFLGGGFKVRLLTYVFNRLPIFAMKGAVSGLGVSAPSAFVEFNDLAALAQGVCERIDDFDYLNSLQKNAYEGTRGCFDWTDRGVRFLKALDAGQ